MYIAMVCTECIWVCCRCLQQFHQKILEKTHFKLSLTKCSMLCKLRSNPAPWDENLCEVRKEGIVGDNKETLPIRIQFTNLWCNTCNTSFQDSFSKQVSTEVDFAPFPVVYLSDFAAKKSFMRKEFSWTNELLQSSVVSEETFPA